MTDEMFVDTTPGSPDDAISMPPPSGTPAPGPAPSLAVADPGNKKAPYTLVVGGG